MSSSLPAPFNQATEPHVLIVGGGIGGLCLAQGLKKHGISFTVFERDPTPTYRTQGYRLRITHEGYSALEASLSPSTLELFRKSTAEFRPGFTFLDPKTAEAVRPGPGQGPPPSPINPETSPSDSENATDPPSWAPPRPDRDPTRVFTVDRLVLRSVLLTDLSEKELQFGMAFKEYEVLNDGRVQVTFDNGHQAVGSVLVGVDGTYSRVRKQYLADATQLLDTDGRAIYGKTLLTPAIEAVFPAPALKSTTLLTNKEPHMSLFLEPIRFTQGNPRDLAPHLPNVQDYIYWVLIGRSAHFQTQSRGDKETLALSPQQVAGLSLEVTHDWHPSVRALFELQERDLCSLISVSSMSPELKHWTSSQVTVMGDAIHAMTPAGIGANVALQDADVLLASFLEFGVGVEAVAAYERQMRVCACEAIVNCTGAGKKMYGQPDFADMKRMH